MDAEINSLYVRHNNSYFGRHGKDVWITVACVFVVSAALMYNSYTGMLGQARSNWAENQCNPIYMPFAGVIVPKPGESSLKTTVDNFDYCMHRNISALLSTLFLPFEFVNFLILNMLNTLILSMAIVMNLYAILSKMFQQSGNSTTNYLAKFIVPLTIMLAKMRDAMARATATLLTSVYTAYIAYSIIVSGLLSINNILLDLLIMLTGAIIAMIVVGIILISLVFTFPIGVALISVAVVTWTVVGIPFIILYVILQTFMSSTFGKAARPAPSGPKFPKIKKPKFKNW
jgi:hypothetical protein